jgi:hypothetical protein
MTEDKGLSPIANELIRRGQLTVVERHEGHEGTTVTFARDGWVYQEFPTGFVTRCCRLDAYVDADWPELDVNEPWV